jgi:hypothetical protein
MLSLSVNHNCFFLRDFDASLFVSHVCDLGLMLVHHSCFFTIFCCVNDGHLNLFHLLIELQPVSTDLVITDPTFGLDMGSWDTKPTEEHWRRMFQVIKIINSNPNLPIYVYHHHDCLLTLERIAEEEWFKLRCWGVCVKDDKHDAGGNHLINNCTMYSFITFGLPDKIYWQAPKNPASAERTNVIHYTSPSKWVTTANGEILNPCQKSAMIEKIWIERHTRTSPDSVVLSLYSGTGTTATLAMKMGRSSVSVDNRESQVGGVQTAL